MKYNLPPNVPHHPSGVYGNHAKLQPNPYQERAARVGRMRLLDAELTEALYNKRRNRPLINIIEAV